MAFGSAFQINAFQSDAFEMTNITSTAIIQKPVDYALAGDQNDQGRTVRSGRLAGSAMKHAFGE